MSGEIAARQLFEEANHVHRALFGEDAPDALRQQYATALAGRLAGDRDLDLQRLVDAGADLEAIELALRRRRVANALTQRFQVVCYLAEVRSDRYGDFINERRRFIAAAATLAAHVLRSLYKLVKGQRLLERHGLG